MQIHTSMSSRYGNRHKRKQRYSDYIRQWELENKRIQKYREQREYEWEHKRIQKYWKQWEDEWNEFYWNEFVLKFKEKYILDNNYYAKKR